MPTGLRPGGGYVIAKRRLCWQLMPVLDLRCCCTVLGLRAGTS